MDIKQALDQLADLRAVSDALHLDYEEKRKALIPPEVAQAIDELDAEYSATIKAAGENAEALAAQIKAAVIEHGETVKGGFLQAVYAKGRVSWDTKALDGYAAGHPEIAPFRKVGEPTVSIRTGLVKK